MAETRSSVLHQRRPVVRDERELEPTERECGVQFLPRESEQAEMDDFLQRLCPPLPNRDTGDVEVLVLSQLPTGNNCFLAGDFNGHSVLWDTVQLSDSRGERIEEWIAETISSAATTGRARAPSVPQELGAPRTFFWRLPRWPAECPGTWETTWDHDRIGV